MASGSDFSGNRIPGIPKHHARVQIAYESDAGLFADCQTRWVGGFYADDANQERIDAYWVTDLTLGWRMKAGRWTVEPFAGVRNVFDEQFFANVRINAFGGRYFEPAPGRDFFGGIRVRLNFD